MADAVTTADAVRTDTGALLSVRTLSILLQARVGAVG